MNVMMMPLEADHWLLEASLQMRGHPCQTPAQALGTGDRKGPGALLWGLRAVLTVR